MKDFDQAIQLESKCAVAQVARGLIFLVENDEEQASQAILKAYQLDKENLIVLVGQALLARYSKKPDPKRVDAIFSDIKKYFNKPANQFRYSEQKRIYFLYGLIAQQRGDVKTARSAFEHVLSIGPHPRAQQVLDQLKAQMSPVLPTVDGGKDNNYNVLYTVSYNELKVGQELGQGGFGTVFKGRWQHVNVAIKKLNINKLTDKGLKDFMEEAQLMSQLRHPHVVFFFRVCVEPGKYCIVMEYCDNGSLYDWLRTPAGNANWPENIRMSVEIGKGLSYLHAHKILHRDLKSLNVLLDENLKAKLSDFGLSKIKLESGSTSTNKNKVIGTLRWLPPEIVSGKERHHTEKSDIYSYGMILWELASQRIPFDENHNDMIVASWIANGKKEEIPASTPYSLAKLMGKCWDERSEDRPTAKAVVEELESVQISLNKSTTSGYRPNITSGEDNMDTSNSYRPNILS